MVNTSMRSSLADAHSTAVTGSFASCAEIDRRRQNAKFEHDSGAISTAMPTMVPLTRRVVSDCSHSRA